MLVIKDIDGNCLFIWGRKRSSEGKKSFPWWTPISAADACLILVAGDGCD